MPKIYRLSKTGLRIFYKIRHRRGHGIHSPFVFSLITKVIEEKSPYYAYDDIRRHLESCRSRKRLNKSHLLAFRLVNYFAAKNILEIGAEDGLNTLCLTAASTNTCCNVIEPDCEKQKQIKDILNNWNREIYLHADKLPTLANKQDCIYINLKSITEYPDNFWDYVLSLIHQESFVIIKGIRSNKNNKLLWDQLRNHPKATVSLDLFRQGLIFFDPNLYKRTYIISF